MPINVDKLNRGFVRFKNSNWHKRKTFFKIHLIRIFQSFYIVFHNPIVLESVFKVIKNLWIRKKPQLRSLELAITYRCNARCAQCSCRKDYSAERERRERLTLDQFKDAVDQAVEMGAFQFCINGGEPTLYRDDVLALTKYINSKGAHVHLCTNGFLMDEDFLRTLKKAGLNSIEMGFDGSTKEIHDRNRLKGGYEKILEVIRIAKSLKMLVVLNTVLSNDKVMSEEIYRILDVAKKYKTLLMVTPACLTGAFKNRLDFLLTDETKLFFYYFLSLSFRCRTDLYGSLTLKLKCPAAVEKMGLQPYGDVVSCPLIQLKYGNIKKAKLKDIQREMLKNPYYGREDLYGCLPSMDENFIKSYLAQQSA